MNNIPQNWVWSTVGELYNIVGGGTPSTNKPEYWSGEIPWISSADIFGIEDIRPRRYINNTAIKESATNLVPEGSIIVVTRVGLGKVALTSSNICFSQDSQALVGNCSFIIPEYALYYLSEAVQLFKYDHRGTTIGGVTKKQLSELIFYELGNELRLAAAIKLFELGRLSSGAAARLAGMPRTLFLTRLAAYGVDTFRLTEEELKSEAALA